MWGRWSPRPLVHVEVTTQVVATLKTPVVSTADTVKPSRMYPLAVALHIPVIGKASAAYGYHLVVVAAEQELVLSSYGRRWRRGEVRGLSATATYNRWVGCTRPHGSCALQLKHSILHLSAWCTSIGMAVTVDTTPLIARRHPYWGVSVRAVQEKLSMRPIGPGRPSPAAATNQGGGRLILGDTAPLARGEGNL